MGFFFVSFSSNESASSTNRPSKAQGPFCATQKASTTFQSRQESRKANTRAQETSPALHCTAPTSSLHGVRPAAEKGFRAGRTVFHCAYVEEKAEAELYQICTTESTDTATKSFSVFRKLHLSALEAFVHAVTLCYKFNPQ